MAANTFDILHKVVREAKCLPGWRFSLVDDDGDLRLHIRVEGVDNYAHDKPFGLYHEHPVPTTTFGEPAWRRWLFEQCLRTMNHEIGESLRFGDDEVRPFEPTHGPGEDPYTVHEYRPATDVLVTQSGEMREPVRVPTDLTNAACDLLDRHWGPGRREVKPDVDRMKRTLRDFATKLNKA